MSEPETSTEVEDEVTKVWNTFTATFCTIKICSVVVKHLFQLGKLESLFSANYVKRDKKNVACMILKVTSYEPDITALAEVVSRIWFVIIYFKYIASPQQYAFF